MPKHLARYLTLALVALVAASRASASTPYWKCDADRISVVTNSSASRCERLIGVVVRYEEILVELAGLEPDSTLQPLKFYSVTREDAKRFMFSEEELEEQRRTRIITYSKYLPNGEDNLAAIVDQAGDEALQSALFLHGQQLLSYEATRSYPIWYQLGVAGLLNGLVIKPDGTALLNRNPMFTARLERGERKAERMELSQLLNVSPDDLSSADFNELSERAHVWAQFGVLTTPARRSQYREMALLMRQGTPLEEASQEAFGKSFADLETEFNSGRWRSEVSFRLAPSNKQVTMSVPVQLESAEFESRMQILKERAVQ